MLTEGIVNNRRVINPGLVQKRLPGIIEASTHEFGTKGFHAATVHDVAKRAGVSVGMIYQYAADKEDLLYLTISEIVAEYVAEIERVLGAVSDPYARFTGVVMALASVVDRRKVAARLGYRESRYLTREHLDDIKARERLIGAMVARCVEECVAAAVFRADVNVQMLSYQCMIFVQSWAVSSWRLPKRLTCGEYVMDGLRLLLTGVMSGPLDERAQPALQSGSRRSRSRERREPANGHRYGRS
jgi:AcrR family transcriptional regulator